MRSFRDAKAMAASLRDAVEGRKLPLSHSDALEIVARQFGCADWNTLSAKIRAEDAPRRPKTQADEPQFKRAIPILRIFSEEKAKEFYVDYLGFRIDWEHRFGENLPLYLQVSRSGLPLHLSEHHGDGTPGATVFLWMHGIKAYHAELRAKDYRYYKPGLEEAPWDAWVMTLKDPFGNTLRLSEPFAADDPRA